MDNCVMDPPVEWLLAADGDGSMMQEASYSSSPIQIIPIPEQSSFFFGRSGAAWKAEVTFMAPPHTCKMLSVLGIT